MQESDAVVETKRLPPTSASLGMQLHCSGEEGSIPDWGGAVDLYLESDATPSHL